MCDDDCAEADRGCEEVILQSVYTRFMTAVIPLTQKNQWRLIQDGNSSYSVETICIMTWKSAQLHRSDVEVSLLSHHSRCIAPQRQGTSAHTSISLDPEGSR